MEFINIQSNLQAKVDLLQKTITNDEQIKLLEKTAKVVNGCTTIGQIRSAEEYVSLAEQTFFRLKIE